MSHEIIEVAEPEYEIVVKRGDEEIAVIGIFDAGNGDFDVVVGVSDQSVTLAVESCLQLAGAAVQGATFEQVRDVSPNPEVPFEEKP